MGDDFSESASSNVVSDSSADSAPEAEPSVEIPDETPPEPEPEPELPPEIPSEPEPQPELPPEIPSEPEPQPELPPEIPPEPEAKPELPPDIPPEPELEPELHPDILPNRDMGTKVESRSDHLSGTVVESGDDRLPGVAVEPGESDNLQQAIALETPAPAGDAVAQPPASSLDGENTPREDGGTDANPSKTDDKDRQPLEETTDPVNDLADKQKELPAAEQVVADAQPVSEQTGLSQEGKPEQSASPLPEAGVGAALAQSAGTAEKPSVSDDVLQVQQKRNLDEKKVSKPINSDFAGDTYSLDDAAAKKVEKSDFVKFEDGKVILNADDLLKVLKTQDVAEKYPTGVEFDEEGYPDFSPYAYIHPETGERVIKEIDMKGNHSSDYKKANEAAGLDKKPKGYTWHHHQDKKTMILIPTDLHGAVRHSGGVAATKHQHK